MFCRPVGAFNILFVFRDLTPRLKTSALLGHKRKSKDLKVLVVLDRTVWENKEMVG